MPYFRIINYGALKIFGQGKIHRIIRKLNTSKTIKIKPMLQEMRNILKDHFNKRIQYSVRYRGLFFFPVKDCKVFNIPKFIWNGYKNI